MVSDIRELIGLMKLTIVAPFRPADYDALSLILIFNFIILLRIYHVYMRKK